MQCHRALLRQSQPWCISHKDPTNAMSAMNRQIRIMVFILTLPLIYGCTPNRESAENRRLDSIQFVQRWYVNSEHKSEAKMGRDVLDALSASSSETLKQPEIASAYIVGRANRTNLNHVYYFDFYVLWIESQPSVDSMEFSLPSLDSNVELPISEADAKDNQMVGKQGVVFTARNQWTKGSKIGGLLDSLTEGKNPKVRLLRDRKAVTEWYPVSIITMDHWIANIPNPHSKQLNSTNQP